MTVISPAVDAYAAVDPRLEEQVPQSARIVRTRWINTRQRFSVLGRYPALLAVPDAWIGWLPFGVAAARRVLETDPAQIIYSTSPHATAHLIASKLARVTHLAWVADFRDPWFEDTPEPGAPSGRVYRLLDRALERRVIERCAHVVTTTTRLRDKLRERYSHLPQQKFSAIPNGYDEADFSAVAGIGNARNQRLVILHAGSINAGFRDPRPLFRAIDRLARQGSVERDRLVVRFVGGGAFADSDAIRSVLAATQLDRHVEFTDRVSYAEALRELGSADLLLLLQASEDTVDLVPAKLYEYLRAQKPVLALAYQGATAEVMAATGGGWVVDPRNDAALDNAISTAYAAWLAGTLGSRRADLDALRSYDRRMLTGQLAMLFDRLRSNGRSG